jgi:hypothetical protein
MKASAHNLVLVFSRRPWERLEPCRDGGHHLQLLESTVILVQIRIEVTACVLTSVIHRTHCIYHYTFALPPLHHPTPAKYIAHVNTGIHTSYVNIIS